MHYTNERTRQHPTAKPNPIEYGYAPMTIAESEYRSSAKCDHCGWVARGVTMARIRNHVLTNPGHQVTAKWAATETFAAR